MGPCTGNALRPTVDSRCYAHVRSVVKGVEFGEGRLIKPVMPVNTIDGSMAFAPEKKDMTLF